MATTDDTYGRKKTARAIRVVRDRCWSPRAMPSAIAIATGTCSVYSSVFRNETHTSGSRASAVKLSSPTNGRTGSIGLQRCNAR
jgi:hypothetical protein